MGKRWSVYDTPSKQYGFGQYQLVRRMASAGFVRRYKGRHHQGGSGLGGASSYDTRKVIRPRHFFSQRWRPLVREYRKRIDD